MAEVRRAGIRPRTWVVGGAVLAVVAGAVVVAALLLRPVAMQGASAPTPTASLSEVIVSGEQLDQLAAELKSGDRDTLSYALALPVEEVTTEVVRGFAGLEIVWDTAAAKPAEDVDGVVVGWNIPAEVTQPDGAASQWIVTVVPGENGLILLDSAEVAA